MLLEARISVTMFMTVFLMLVSLGLLLRVIIGNMTLCISSGKNNAIMLESNQQLWRSHSKPIVAAASGWSALPRRCEARRCLRRCCRRVRASGTAQVRPPARCGTRYDGARP